jgi:DNA-directed RNA polymerase subunit RPC12/RpoP
MNTPHDDRDADACPNCGTRVESQISGPGDELREATERRCPNCGKRLLRVVGGTWAVDDVTAR